MDEVGCGISIYDGLFLVWVCVFDLIKCIKCLCLFVIYYFELIELVKEIVIDNYYVIVKEFNGNFILLYKV